MIKTIEPEWSVRLNELNTDDTDPSLLEYWPDTVLDATNSSSTRQLNCTIVIVSSDV